MSPLRLLSRFLPGVLAALLICLPLHSVAAQQGVAPNSAQAAAEFEGDVYILRGGAGIFSIGLTKLAAKLKQNGVEASVKSHAAWQLVARTIVKHQAQYGRRPVILIGHSLGADSAVKMAHALKRKGVQVDYIASFAATGLATIPSNVSNVTNFYFKTGGWGGLFTAESDFQGQLNNMDMSAQPGMTHFNIDDANALHELVVRDVLRYMGPSTSAMLPE